MSDRIKINTVEVNSRSPANRKLPSPDPGSLSSGPADDSLAAQASGLGNKLLAVEPHVGLPA
ncbi:MAG: hypothetical protein A2Z37_02225 [Chloroflexi bacterium RBG_19FT_COMBO_62_14]|nr:MAG: hypothetical protein A2Z37_02225 [Chloroflexi bacterium RBG_19FT_COMBO_62_14]